MTTANATEPVVMMRAIDDILPAPENDKLYTPIDPAAPDFIGLVESVRERGVQQPIVVCRDSYILSGHRRRAAAKAAGRAEAPVIVDDSVSWKENPAEFVRLLADHNRQRVKTLAEQAREAVVLTDRDDAYNALIEHRERKSDLSDFEQDAMRLGAAKARKAISQAKRPMLDAAIKIINDHRGLWPLSDRSIHYLMLNIRPPRHAARPTVRYENDIRSYKDLTDLLTRARLAGLISWAAIADPTRPVTTWQAHPNAGAFIRAEVDDFAKVYWRDLMQSQPNHIEVIGEKMTMQRVIEQVTMRYCIPTSIGRGYCSSPPRHEMAQRFRRSGKDKLVLLLLSDHDPDGEQIAESFARSMRDEFAIPNVVAKKVAITREHVTRYRLPPTMEAKKSSVHHGKFVKAHGRHAYELEALPPDVLQDLLREAIDSVIDVDAFNREVSAEAEDAKRIAAYRRVLLDAMAGTEFDQ